MRGGKHYLIAGFLALSLSLLFVGLWRENPFSDKDADRYYHFAVSREMVKQHGILRILPQAEDLGWGDYFPDKEFLFHAGTAVFYAWNKDPGVVLFCSGLAVGVILLCFLSAAELSGCWPAFLLAIVTLLAGPLFMLRLSLVRPHVLAIFCTCLLLTGLARRRTLLSGIGAFLFPLGYHAFYIPLALIGCFLLVDAWKKKSLREIPGHLWAALAALSAGILVNPYFPSNIVMSWTHALIAMKSGIVAGLPVGMELQAYSPAFALANFLPYLFLLVLGWLALKESPHKSEALSLGIASLLFWILFTRSGRAVEYAVPCSFFFVAFSVRREFFLKRSASALLLACIVFQSWNLLQYWRELKDGSAPGVLAAAQRENISAVGALPSGEGKVFHCNWSVSPYILYFRPELRFVDILDPTLLYLRSPELSEARAMLSTGRARDPYKLLREMFHAKYVLCEHLPLVEQLLKDSRFQKIYKSETGSFFIFGL